MFEGKSFVSAEKNHLINPEAFELRVHRFVTDPVATLAEIHQEHIRSAEVYEDFDKLGETFVLIDEFKEFMHEHKLTTTNQPLHDYLTYGSYTVEGDTGLFSLLRDAGYDKAEITAWLNYGMDMMPSDDKFMVRQSLAVLNRVYGNN